MRGAGIVRSLSPQRDFIINEFRPRENVDRRSARGHCRVRAIVFKKKNNKKTFIALPGPGGGARRTSVSARDSRCTSNDFARVENINERVWVVIAERVNVRV